MVQSCKLAILLCFVHLQLQKMRSSDDEEGTVTQSHVCKAVSFVVVGEPYMCFMKSCVTDR